MRNLLTFLLLTIALSGCSREEAPETATSVADTAAGPSADAIFVNGNIYTVDDAKTSAKAFAVKDGKFLAVGSDEDFLLVPLSPGTAQRIADRVGCLLPTPRMVDAVWAAARVRLEPSPISPSPEMTTVPVFEAHSRMVAAQWRNASAPRGSLVSGHKKDVVITSALASLPNRVAIYGWHRLTGEPIQPLYTGHSAGWADYSHGIRLVLREVTVDGTRRDLPEVLRDPGLAPLLSDEGVIAEARYATPGG